MRDSGKRVRERERVGERDKEKDVGKRVSERGKKSKREERE